MNWRKDWRRGVCTLLIVTAEAHRVYDATHPRTRKPGPGAAGQDEQLLVSKTKCLQAKESALENDELREQLAASDARAAKAEANLAASTSQVKESTLEIKDLRERNAALEEDVVALRASSLFEVSVTEEAAQHRRLGAYASSVTTGVPFFGKCYDPVATTQLQWIPATVRGDPIIGGEIPTEIGLLTELTALRVPPRPQRPARRATAPRRRRHLAGQKIDGPIPTEIGLLKKLHTLRVPPASPTPGAARDRLSASQEPRQQPDHRPDPARDRQAHGAEAPASSPRVPDARRAARPTLGVAGTSPPTRSPARSRPRSASSRICSACEFPPRPRRPARRATAPRRQVPRREPDLRHVPARPLRRRVLQRQVRQRPRRAVRHEGLLRSREGESLPEVQETQDQG